MRLHEFSATGFRNLAPLSLSPHPGLNVIHGRNAQGKTNLLEALFYVASLRSFRTRQARQLIGWEAAFVRLDARAEAGGRTTQLRVTLSAEGRRLQVDGAAVEAVDEYFGGFNAVLFTPEHLTLVRGEPASRRSFLDRALFNVDPGQLACVRRYNRVLKERNACLKRYGDGGGHGLAAPLLDVLDQQLAGAAADLVDRRQGLRFALAPRVAELYQRISDDEKPVALRYRCRGLPEAKTLWDGDAEGDVLDAYRDLLRDRLAQRRDDDLRRGFTSLGPHQDDLDIRLDHRSARNTASQGEARTLVLSLKLAEVQHVHERRSEPPVLLLDDIGSELDDRRREILFSTLAPLGCQTFLTTVSRDLVPHADERVYFTIESGVLAADS